MLQRDREKWRDDFSARFCVVHEDDTGTVDGYCWYRVKESDDEDGVARGKVKIWDLAAESPEVEAALLQYLASIDLTRSITTWTRPVDDPWPYRLATAAGIAQLVHDHLYVRVLDVRAALSACTYESPGAPPPSRIRSGRRTAGCSAWRSARRARRRERVNGDGADRADLRLGAHRSRVAVPRVTSPSTSRGGGAAGPVRRGATAARRPDLPHRPQALLHLRVLIPGAVEAARGLPLLPRTGSWVAR